MTDEVKKPRRSGWWMAVSIGSLVVSLSSLAYSLYVRHEVETNLMLLRANCGKAPVSARVGDTLRRSVPHYSGRSFVEVMAERERFEAIAAQVRAGQEHTSTTGG